MFNTDYRGILIYDTRTDGSPLEITGLALELVISYAVKEDWMNQNLNFACGVCQKGSETINGNLKKNSDVPRRNWNQGRRRASNKEGLQSMHISSVLQSSGQQGEPNRNLNSTDFRVKLANYTGLDLVLVGALPYNQGLNLTLMGCCGAFYFGTNKTQYSSYWYCSKYKEYKCDVNDFIDYSALSNETCTDENWDDNSWDDYWVWDDTTRDDDDWVDHYWDDNYWDDYDFFA